MTDELPKSIEVSLASLAELAVEWWRLDRWAGDASESPAQARHVARRMRSFLDAHGLEVLDVTGRAYEPGLAVEVLDAYTDSTLPPRAQLIAETVSPIILWRGSVVRFGQVVIKTSNE
jgi:hypothetical protein